MKKGGIHKINFQILKGIATLYDQFNYFENSLK